jgi:hypothetical protein
MSLPIRMHSFALISKYLTKWGEFPMATFSGTFEFEAIRNSISPFKSQPEGSLVGGGVLRSGVERKIGPSMVQKRQRPARLDN